MMKRGLISAVGALFGFWAVTAWAGVVGGPVDGGFALQAPATPIAAEAFGFYNHLVLPIITAIVIFVAALLVWIMVRYNSRANPVPSKTTHHTMLEVVWTLVPILILIVIAVPSFRLLTHEDTIPEADFAIKATGNQWYWSYEYPDQGGFAFDAYLKPEAELAANEPYLLATDNRLVVPVGATVKLIVTASDVLHSWAVPSFNIKIDAVPGRINEAWFRVDQEGIYYGQCSELCGKDHGYMPIAVEVVSREAFDAWVKDAQTRFAAAPSPTALRIAAR